LTGAFLASAGSAQVPVNHSLAAYLAEQGVDVWGIDLRWVGVPQEVTVFTFMAGWNMGTALARAVRVGTKGSQDRIKEGRQEHPSRAPSPRRRAAAWPVPA
jgi:hypothetical protein